MVGFMEHPIHESRGRTLLRRTLMILPPILFLAYTAHSVNVLRELMLASSSFHLRFANDLVQDYLAMELALDRDHLIRCRLQHSSEDPRCFQGRWLNVQQASSPGDVPVFEDGDTVFVLRTEVLGGNLAAFLESRHGLGALVERRANHEPVYWFRILDPKGREVFRSHETPTKWVERQQFAMDRSLAQCQLDLVYSSFGPKQLYSVAKSRINLGVIIMLGILAIFSIILMTRSIRQKLLLARQRTFFVSTVSHEFKTPLAIIRLAAETLESQRYRSEDERMTFHQMMVREINRLDLLVKKVLSFNKMGTGYFSVNHDLLDLRGVIRQSVDVFSVQAESDQVELQLQMPDEPCWVLGDSEALRLGIDNLIDNAFKYRGDSRVIAVSLAEEAGDWVLRVNDQGIGMSASQARQAVKSFYRVDDPKVHAVRGSGLGLAISSYVFREVQAKLEIVSELGQGTTVTVRFPKKDEPVGQT